MLKKVVFSLFLGALYLDDFLVLGPPEHPGCEHALTSTLSLCAELGFPVASEKTEGPHVLGH